jgi:UDP-glucuronate 4-epimerase
MTRIVDSAPQGDPNWSATKPDPGSSKAPWRIYNIGNNRPEEVALLEKALGRQAEKKLLPIQAGDVLETFADVDDLMRDIDFKPRTSIEDGVEKFVAWYRDYHRG